MNLENYINKIKDFPKTGILFYDISPMLSEPKVWQYIIDELAIFIKKLNPDYIIGVEARGFLLAAPLGYKLEKGFFMLRKKGKLPGKVFSYKYDLEYGSAEMELNQDAIHEGAKYLILDDIIATGGSMRSGINLLRDRNCKVIGCGTIMRLTRFKDSNDLGLDTHSLLDIF